MPDIEELETRHAIHARRAVREYHARPIARDVIATLIEAAVQAPSAMDLQPWAFVVFEGVERLRGYSELAKAHVLKSPAAAERVGHLLGENVNIFHDAPVLVVVCATDASRQAAEDCCLAAQNFMLAAYVHGLGTCPIGLSREWLEDAGTKSSLGIPAALVPVFPVVLGYPKAWPPSPGRKPPQIVWPS